ncbi:MAG TPA: energy transducer TonB [Candidatus Acidoferrales bacterium]|nr:energy transducer TonB [Candidatus Acidoferrales bacterium]
MDDLAEKIAGAISASKQKSVVVLDFLGPGMGYSGLGKTIADEFSDALRKSARDFLVLDRSKVSEQERRFSYLDYASGGFMVAGLYKAHVVIFGRLSAERGQLSLVADSYKVSKGKRIGGFGVELRISPNLGTEIQEALQEDGSGVEPTPIDGLSANQAKLKKEGYTFPMCLKCPAAQLSDQGAKELLSMASKSATVVLEGVVDPNGFAQDLHVVKRGPGDLSASALRAVLTWQFKPGKDPNGNLVPFRVDIMVDYRIY